MKTHLFIGLPLFNPEMASAFRVTRVYTISFTKCNQQSPSLGCLYLRLGDQVRVVILQCTTSTSGHLSISLAEMSKMLLLLESLRLMILGDFNIHAKISQDEAAQDFCGLREIIDLFVSTNSPGWTNIRLGILFWWRSWQYECGGCTNHSLVMHGERTFW